MWVSIKLYLTLKFNWGLCNPVQVLKGNCFPDYSLIFTLQGTEHNTHNDLNVRTLEFAYYNIDSINFQLYFEIWFLTKIIFFISPL